MNISQLRTRTEKTFYPIALIFSGLVWFLILLTPIIIMMANLAKFNDNKMNPPPPCVFIYGESYYYTSVDKAPGDVTCLSEDEVPIDVWEEAKLKIKVDGPATPLAIILVSIMTSSVIFFYIFLFILFIYVSTALSMAFIRLNGLRLSKTQYASFYKIYEEAARELGIEKIPNAYIIQADGALNAFAIKISRKKMIVFFADLIEHLVEENKFDELKAIAAHELTHVKLKHVNYWIYLLPFTYLPFFGKWLSRAREYSADRGAYFVCKNKDIVSTALVKLVTGKYVAAEVNVEEYMNQPKTERGFFTFVAKLISTHPPIPYRIKALHHLGSQE